MEEYKARLSRLFRTEDDVHFGALRNLVASQSADMAAGGSRAAQLAEARQRTWRQLQFETVEEEDSDGAERGSYYGPKGGSKKGAPASVAARAPQAGPNSSSQ